MLLYSKTLHLFYVQFVQILNVFIFTLLCVQFISAKVTELSPVWERAANSAYHMLSVVCYDMFVRLSL